MMGRLKADDFDCQTGLCTCLIPVWWVSWAPMRTVSGDQLSCFGPLCFSHTSSIGIHCVVKMTTYIWPYDPLLKVHLGGWSVESRAYCDPALIQLVSSVFLCTTWTTATERTTTNFMSHLFFERQSIILVDDHYQCNILMLSFNSDRSSLRF